MKKTSIKLIITMAVLLGISSIANAETTKFTPLNFDNSGRINTPSSTVAVATTTGKTVSGVDAKGTDLLDPSQVTGGTKMQNAILQIDNAQVEMRNKLLNYRNAYAEVDSRYNIAKTERKAAKKQIEQAEKKIKNLEKAKKKIRNNFERKVNI